MAGAAPPGWCAAYIGRPFRLGGRGPADYDCYGLVRAVSAERFGVVLPACSSQTPATVADRAAIAALYAGRDAAAWAAVAERTGPGAPLVRHAAARPGDVLLLRLLGHDCHIGLVVASGWMLHVEEGVATVLDRYDRDPWQRRISGIYRYRGLTG